MLSQYILKAIPVHSIFPKANSLKKIILSLSLVFVSLHAAVAQTVLLNEDRNHEVINKEGQNLKRFSHLFLQLGCVAGSDNPGARIQYGSSVNVSLGVRKKFKISPAYSIGYDFLTSYSDFKLKQVPGKILPDTFLNKSQRLDYYTLALGLFNRINFDPHRGNYIGNYLDIGIMGGWNYSVRDVSKNNTANGTKTKTVISNLPFTNDVAASLYARIGISHLSLYMTYRLTHLFKKSWSYPELPAATVGVELGLF